MSKTLPKWCAHTWFEQEQHQLLTAPDIDNLKRYHVDRVIEVQIKDLCTCVRQMVLHQR